MVETGKWDRLSRNILAEVDRLEQARRRRIVSLFIGLLLIVCMFVTWFLLPRATPEYHQPQFEHHFQDGSTFVLFIRDVEPQHERDGD